MTALSSKPEPWPQSKSAARLLRSKTVGPDQPKISAQEVAAIAGMLDDNGRPIPTAPSLPTTSSLSVSKPTRRVQGLVIPTPESDMKRMITNYIRRNGSITVRKRSGS